MTQTLYLLRHAKSEPWTPGINDFQRTLSERGRIHMSRLSAWLEEHLPKPEEILCSSATRTRQTLDGIESAWPDTAAVTRYVDEIYEASTGTLHALAEQAFSKANSLLMVGHNPGFEYLFSAVTRDEDMQSIYKMPTGALAVIEFENGYRDDAGQGRLKHWVRWREFKTD